MERLRNQALHVRLEILIGFPGFLAHQGLEFLRIGGIDVTLDIGELFVNIGIHLQLHLLALLDQQTGVSMPQSMGLAIADHVGELFAHVDAAGADVGSLLSSGADDRLTPTPGML